MNTLIARPWYREPWPWILMSGPAIVVVAGVMTAVIAWRTDDPLVTDDYYKQGLGINQELKRDFAAARMGLSAAVSFGTDRTRVRVTLAGAQLEETSLRLRLVHPTRAGFDQVVKLEPVAGGLFEGHMSAVIGDTWHLQLEDDKGVWRLTGLWKSSADGVTLGRATN